MRTKAQNIDDRSHFGVLFLFPDIMIETSIGIRETFNFISAEFHCSSPLQPCHDNDTYKLLYNSCSLLDENIIGISVY